MGNFFAELRRRHIYRVGAAYVVVAWGITQVVDVLSQVFALPGWIGQPLLIALAVGFPFTLIIAWLIEGKATEAVASAIRSPATTVDWALFGALAVVIGLMGYQQINSSSSVQQAGLAEAFSAATDPNTAVSIAVLPFANVSADPAQQFFSDGMTDEIAAALTKIPDLQVVARSSAFQFREVDSDIASVGEALNATHLVEGSVRKDGQRVRISAQLVRADNGLQMWSENYDRELTDIFAIQEEVAQAVARSLGMQVGLSAGASAVSNRTEDLENYQKFLELRSNYRGRTNFNGDRSLTLVELELLTRQVPRFAPAWGLLAQVYLDFPILDVRMMNLPVEEIDRLTRDTLEKAETAAKNALGIDPEQVNAYAALGEVEKFRMNWVASEDLFLHALNLDPNDTDALYEYGQMLRYTGRLTEALAQLQKANQLEPLVNGYRRDLGLTLRLLGRYDESVSEMEAFGNLRGIYLVQRALSYAAAGRFDDAADLLLLMPPDRYAGVVGQDGGFGSLIIPPSVLEGTEAPSPEDMAALIRSAPTQVDNPNALPILPSQLNDIYLYVGAPERIMEAPERALEADTISNNGLQTLWHPLSAPVRQTERFKTYIRNIGLDDYWREREFADDCRPVGGDDFECD